MKIRKQPIIAVLIVAAGILSFVLFMKFRVKPQKITVEYKGPLVETIRCTTDIQPMDFITFGTVDSSKKINILPQVQGKIVKVSENFKEGGFFKKGEILIFIEDTDYKLALERAKANLLNQEVNYKKALKQAKIAKEQWEEIYSEILKGEKIVPDELTLYIPQLKAAKASFDAAKAEVETARLNLERTKIKAPFDGYIITKNADVGQVVSIQTVLCSVYSANNIEIIAPLNKIEANFIDKNSKAQLMVTNKTDTITLNAKVDRLSAAYNLKTRLIDVYIVPTDKNAHKFLKLGDFVKCKLKSVPVKCAKIPINSYRDGKVWLYSNGKLTVKKAGIIYEDEKYAYVSGLPAEFDLITTNLFAVSNGMKVRVAETKQ